MKEINPSVDQQDKKTGAEPIGKPANQPIEPGDYYYEGPYIVFTEAYHLKRGYCCNSGCRHCPYR